MLISKHNALTTFHMDRCPDNSQAWSETQVVLFSVCLFFSCAAERVDSISLAFMEWDISVQRSAVERGGIAPSENLQNSSDGMLTQGRNWRQSIACTCWPAQGSLSGHQGLWAGHSLALWPSSEESKKWASGDPAFLVRSRSREHSPYWFSILLQNKSHSPLTPLIGSLQQLLLFHPKTMALVKEPTPSTLPLSPSAPTSYAHEGKGRSGEGNLGADGPETGWSIWKGRVQE